MRRLWFISKRNYHKKIIDHYENPRNVGSFKKDEKNIGTGLVGAPACIHEDTMIAVADGRRSVSVKTLYLENKIIQVWSYNIEKKIYEIKNARVIKNKFKKPMKKIILDDNSFLMCTDDHKFLLKNNTYLEVQKISKNQSLVPFKNPYSKFNEEQKRNFACHPGKSNGRFIKITNDELLKIGKGLIDLNGKLTVKIWINNANISKFEIPKGSHCIKKRFNVNTWQDFVELCNNYNHKIKNIENLDGEFDCYDLQVEENNNFAVITKETKNIQNGIIIKNCGDVMKLQIKVSSHGIITDAKFKTFGCLAGNVIIATPRGYIKIKSLSIGDTIYAWNGKNIVENEIEEINTKWIHYKELLRLEFEGSHHFKFICSKDHIWWLSSDKPIEASDLKIGDELIHITIDENKIILKIQNFVHNGLKLLNKRFITKKSQLGGLERDNDDNVKLYDIRLKEGANVFFAGRVGTHNCGSAIASSSLATEWIKGKPIEAVNNITNKKIASYLKLPPVKLHCSMLAEDAIKAAVHNYKNEKLKNN